MSRQTGRQTDRQILKDMNDIYLLCTDILLGFCVWKIGKVLLEREGEKERGKERVRESERMTLIAPQWTPLCLVPCSQKLVHTHNTTGHDIN